MVLKKYLPMRKLNPKYLCIVILCIVGLFVIQISLLGVYRFYKRIEVKWYSAQNKANLHHSALNQKKIDWTDYEFIKKERERTGPGEHGAPVVLKDSKEVDQAQLVIDTYAHNGYVSDLISLDRALPDSRHSNCKTRTYYADLPSVSVVIVFRDEYLSPLLRTLHSIINRTPKKLLTEIILVDDCSTKDFLKTELDDYIQNYHPDIIRIVRLTEQHGVAKSRMVGINASISEIVVILDAHVEVNTNWLPPLIEPIVDDYQTVTEPLVYHIDSNTYAYDNTTLNGRREAFSWSLTQDWIRRDLSGDTSSPYQTPSILGGLMAINRAFFFELEGYDEGLEVWGGENWDLSFKVWRCSEGTLLIVPCSQVGHNFKSLSVHPYYQADEKHPYLMRNLNRIAEIWLGSPYKEFYRDKVMTKWASYGTGDVSHMIEYRNRKRCKPFRWYVNNIYPEFNLLYPMHIEKVAKGHITNFAYPKLCIDTFDRKTDLGLFECSDDFIPPETQMFIYTPLNEIRCGTHFWSCWDAYVGINQTKATINLADCHYEEGNQFFTYDPKKLTIIHKPDGRCLEANQSGTHTSLYFADCSGGRNQKWMWSFIDHELMEKMAKDPIRVRYKPDPPPPMNRQKIKMGS